jgi:prepilin-type N-terminal cleavage/methylation domain-containing protein
MNKNGFTLIETLVSIVIVSIIAVITVPIIGDVINSIKEQSFKASIEALIRTVRLDVKNNVGVTTYYRIEDNKLTRSGEELKTKGSIEGEGYLIVDEDGGVALNINYSDKCATKEFSDSEVIITDSSCTVSISAGNPAITLIGDNYIEHRVGRNYTDLGVLAMDSTDGNITDKVIITGSVNIDQLGTYNITYSVTNSLGNSSNISRTVKVVDPIPPVITIIGSNPLTYQASSSYVDQGATAIDEYDGDISSKILVTSNVTPGIVGTYKVVYYIIDMAGNSITAERGVNVVDTNMPTVAFSQNGNSTYAKTYSTTVTVTDNGTLNTTTLKYQWTTSATAPSEASFTTAFTNGSSLTKNTVTGGYYLWILAKDTASNTMISKSNVFNLDNAGPTISFGTNGNSTYAKTYSTTVTATDANSGLNTSSLKYQWTTSTTAPTEASFTTTFTNSSSVSSGTGLTGGYYLWILAKDNLSNTTIFSSNAFNLDNTAPTPPVIAANITSLTNSDVAVSFTYSGDSSTKKYLIGANNAVANWQGKTITSTTYNPGWDTSLHTGAIDMSSWSDGYNSGVSTPATGYHAMWVYEGIDGVSDPAVKFIDRNDLYGLGHRWLGVAHPLPTSETTTWVVGDQIIISWMQKTDVSGKGASVGLYHNRVTEGTYGFEACKQLVNTTSTGVWEEASITCAITSNWDLTKSISIYVYGSEGSYGTLWADNVTVSKIENTWADYSSNFNVSNNKTIFAYATDSAGNTSDHRKLVVDNIDKVAPTVTFGTNGNSTYAKSYSTIVTVSDNIAINTSSLEYQWTSSITAPTEASFTTTFTSGGAISSTVGLSGGYYLWIFAKDTGDNTIITRSNVFNLDNLAPVITMSGDNPIILNQFVTYTDFGATATDNIDGDLTTSIISTGNVNTSMIGESTITYRVTDSAGNVATAIRTVSTYPYRTCMAIKTAGFGTYDGVYIIDPNQGSYSDRFNAYCDMTTRDGGWTLVWSNLRAKTNKPTTNMTWINATGSSIFVNGTMSNDKESFEIYTGLTMWNTIINNTQGEFRMEWRYDYGMSKTQEAVYVIKPFNSGDNFALRLSGYYQTVGSYQPGLWSSHNNLPFSTVDSDHDSNSGSCSSYYSGTPFWYGGCWNGNMNGGGQNTGSGYYNGAYWRGADAMWGQYPAYGAGNAWYWLR